MAQTKTKAQSAKSKTKAQSAKSKSKSKSRSSNGGRRRSQKPRAVAKPKRIARKISSTGPAAAKDAVEGTAKDAGRAVTEAASSAKIPLVAAGAAIAGAAGGIAWGTRHANHGGLRRAIARRPMVKISSHDVARAAKEIGQLASDIQGAREANGNGHHRSPIEVVLDGLTARR